MSKKHFIKGTLILTCTGILSRFMGFFYRIFLSHTIGAQGMGLFQLVVPIQTLAMAFSVSGTQTAISRLVSSRMALKREKDARGIFFVGTLWAFLISILLALLMWQHADLFASVILKEKNTYPLIRLIALSFPLGTLHTCINSYYFALKRTKLPSAIQLLEQLVRISVSFLLFRIFLSEGRPLTPVIAAGGTLAGEAAAAFSSIFLIGIHFQKKAVIPRPFASIRILFQEIIHISFPLTLNRILLTLLGSIEVILIPRRLVMSGLKHTEALSIYGVFTGMAMPFILFPCALTGAASTLLVPSVSELQVLGQTKRIRYVISRITCFCLLLGLGCTCMFLLFGGFMGESLFHSITAGIYIRTMAFICPFLYLNATLSSILQGLGKSGLCLIHSLIGVAIRLFFVFCMIPVMGIRGYFLGILLGEFVHTLLLAAALFPYRQDAENSL